MKTETTLGTLGNLNEFGFGAAAFFAVGGAGKDPCPEIVGQSPPMLRLKAALHALAGLEVAVLVRGESGTGKELAAAALHRLSSRARRPCVSVNCAAIPRELLESELFGCEPGAFTGARRREGYVARADRGTLFLDEIGELSLSAQAVLLRVLETGEFIHLRPHGMAAVGLDIGSKVNAQGTLHTTVLGTRMLEAQRVNRVDLV